MLRITVLVVLFAGLLGGCMNRPTSTSDQINAALTSSPRDAAAYTIGPTDVIRISVWRNPDLSVEVPVRPDGQISAPLVGDLEASGKSPEQLAADIREELSVYIKEPEVTVIVTSMGSNEFIDRVRVTGAVRNPISVPYRQGMTVLDMVLNAGGVTEFANGDQARLYRQHQGGVVSIPVDLEAILTEGNVRTNYSMHPGDVLTIPERVF
jgi:polysaccharide export outer membrane protein